MVRILVLMLLPAVAVAAPVPTSLKPKPHVGEWKVVFENGVVEACSLGRDDRTSVAEPLRASAGRVTHEPAGVVVLTFEDDRVERWTPDGTRYVVEHWATAATFPKGVAVRGTAERK